MKCLLVERGLDLQLGAGQRRFSSCNKSPGPLEVLLEVTTMRPDQTGNGDPLSRAVFAEFGDRFAGVEQTGVILDPYPSSGITLALFLRINQRVRAPPIRALHD